MVKEGYIPKDQRKKILLICDDIRSFSGISTATKEIVIHTAHQINWCNIAGAIQHPEKGKRLDLSQEINNIIGIEDSSVYLYPVDGYGDSNFLRQIIQFEKPDALMLVTDPRYFVWLFNIENEIRNKIPIIYLNIWDSPTPYPLWNKPYYEACDLLLAISKQTKNINEVVLGDKAKNKLIKYLPHGLNPEVYFPITKEYPKYNEFQKFKSDLFKGKEYDFVIFFNSRNIRRKQIPDTILAWRLFLDKLTKEKADKCCLLLHTELISEHGTDLIAVKDYLLDEYPNSIIFHQQGIPPDQMNYLYNCSDAQILLTDNEGFGLSLLEARLAGNPIIANVQGGMQDQMRFEDEEGNWLDFNIDFPSNHRGTYKNHGSWAYPVFPSNISIQGSPQTPYISADRVQPENAAEQIMKCYSDGKERRKTVGLIGRDWTISEECGMTSQYQAKHFIEAVDELFRTWKPREKFEFINCTTYKSDVTRKHKLIY